MAFNARLGLVLFSVYCVFYFGFVLVHAFAPRWMSELGWSGLNLAVLWGMGLIGFAFVLALVYGWLCRRESGVGRGAKPDSEPST